MNMRLKSLSFLAVLAMWLLNSQSASATVGLSVSPPAISNDYSGKVTLTITGLTSNQKVQVTRYYDVNANGIIDPGQDVAIESFKMTDGQLPLVNGVRDLNVPGDDDGTVNGQIQAKLNYPSLSDVTTGSTGNFIFKVEDTNGVSLATQVFSVSQKVQPQGVHGRVTLAASGLPLANAPVALINPNSDGSTVLSVTDTNGNYTFYASPASYTVVAAAPGLVSDEIAAYVTVTAGNFVTDNVSLATGAYTISGSLTDASNGKPLATVFVNAQSANNLFSGTLTDTNGNFVLSAVSNQWTIEFDKGMVAQKGYLGPQNKTHLTVSNSSVGNVNFALSKATALIYGTVSDTLSNLIGGIKMTGGDSGNLYEAQGRTGTNGNYSLGVVAGNWNASPDNNALAAKGYSGGGGTNVNLADGQAVEADFVLQGVTAHLRGQVKDDHGNAISNISIVVQPYPIQGNGSGSIYPSTDGSGNFDVGVSGGAWNIALECSSAQSRGYVDVGGFNFNVTNGSDRNGLVLTFPQSTAVINGRITDTSNHPIIGVNVSANQNINSSNSYFPGCVSTDNNGNYQLKVLGGTWMVSVANSDLNAMGYNSVSSSNVTISGGTATANFVATSFGLTPPQFSGGSFSASNGLTLTILGTVGHTNTVQYSSNLLSWFTLTNTVLSNATWFVNDRAVTNQPRRFYRASVSP